MRAFLLALAVLVAVAAPASASLVHSCAARAGMSLCTEADVSPFPCAEATVGTPTGSAHQGIDCPGMDGSGSGSPFEGV